MMKIQSRFLTIIACFLFAGCDLDIPNVEEIVLTIHIERGGTGSIREEFLRITPSKDGSDGERQIENFIESWRKQAPEEEGILASDADNDVDGNLNAFVIRELKSPFQVVEELSGSSPFRLRPNEAFQFSWDGETLSVMHQFLHPEAYDDLDQFRFKIVVTTDGKFLEVGTGDLDADQGRLVITNEHVQTEPRLSFEITDLGNGSESPTRHGR